MGRRAGHGPHVLRTRYAEKGARRLQTPGERCLSLGERAHPLAKALDGVKVISSWLGPRPPPMGPHHGHKVRNISLHSLLKVCLLKELV